MTDARTTSTTPETTPRSHHHSSPPDAHDEPAPSAIPRERASITVSLVNDYEIILRGLHSMLAPFTDRVRVVEHEIGGTPECRADVALFDTFAGRRDALARARKMVIERVVDHVVLFTWDAGPEFLDLARDAGVSGVVLKSADGEGLVRALERVVDGERVGIDHVGRDRSPAGDLSAREREVLAMLALGYGNREIAYELFVSVDTVKTHVRRLFAKLGVTNRTQAALLAAERGVAPPTARIERRLAARPEQ